ncbi:MAG: phosphatidylserine decarboxylase [Euryarchaeota archaeon]|nr:phosphatidylserine decarboxylase [Euryarchaeota archaeon]
MLAKGSENWILGSFILTAFMGFFLPLFVVGIVLTLFLCLFFRDPERLAESHSETDVLSPADGRVLRVQDNKLSIFMNIHNVHVNRSPVDGEVTDIRYHKGGKLPAFHKDSERNERNTIVLSTERGDVTVTQISGAIVRRIVCYIKQNEAVKKGQRIGMIRFGSRVDVTLPRDYSFIVARGQKVKAGKTVIATVPS